MELRREVLPARPAPTPTASEQMQARMRSLWFVVMASGGISLAFKFVLHLLGGS